MCHLSRVVSATLLAVVCHGVRAQHDVLLRPQRYAVEPSPTLCPWTELVLVGAVDFNVDPWPDLLVRDFYGPTYLLLGEGRLRWFEPIRLHSWAAHWQPFDVDGDGDQDLLGAGDRGGLTILWNTTAGFVEQLVHDRSGRVRLLDLDGDGDLEGVNGNSRLWGRGPWDVYDISPNATMSPVDASLPARRMRDAALVVDVNADGFDDLFGFDETGWPMLVLNRGHGRLEDVSATLPPTRSADPYVLQPPIEIDIEADGDADVLVTFFAGYRDVAETLVFVNDGAGRFTARPLELAAAEPRPTPRSVADFDGDGRDDLLTRSPLGRVALYRNVADFVFVEQDVPWSRVDSRLPFATFVDLDGDRAPDVVLGDSDASGVWVNDRLGGFVPLCEPRMPARGVRYVHADFDADGWPDVALERLLRNERNSKFAPAWLDRDLRTLAAADVDADGDVDVVTRDGILQNDGRAGFRLLPDDVPDWKPRDRLWRVQAVDVDADAVPDLVTYEPDDSWPRIYRNDGAGRFDATPSYPKPIGLGADRIRDVDVADVDGDGRPDLLLAGPERHRLWLQTETDGFVDATSRLAVQQNTFSPVSSVVADFDRDGDQDVLLVRDTTRILENRGGGRSFVDTGLLPPVQTWFHAPAFADVDDDGRADVVLRHASEAWVFRGRAASGFGSPTIFSGGGTGYLDLDLDGDLDSQLGTNLVRQLTATNFASIDDGARYEVHVRPGRSMPGVRAYPFLASQGSFAPIAVPGIRGALQLDVSSLVALPRLDVRPPFGHEELVIDLPNAIRLIGRSYWIQCLVADPATSGGWAWTNPLETTIGR